ncbi:MAG: tyrosine-protein phosphatase, partial [Waddliaceae bacterium]
MASRLARFRPPALDLDILQEPPSKSEKVEQLFFALRHQTSQMHSESLDSPIEVYARFGDIECVKSSAVKVDGFKAPYLHANYVNFDTLTIKNAPQEILLSSNILTQYPIGPKEPLGFDTQEMFWKAALDHCHLIVDLTVKEEGMELYYPTELHHSKIQIGNISVTLTQVKKMDFGIEVHRYQVVDMNGQAEKEITRIHHSNWKDHQSVNELEQIEYLKALEDHISLQYPKQKTIVHCRAGVGRSGTYTVASALIELKRQGILEKANITHVIEKLILSGRTMRGPGFVQSKEQLECLLDLGEKLVERGLQEFKIDEQPIQDEEECKVESELDSIFELSVHFKIDRLESHPAYHFNLLQYPNEIVSVTADQIAQSACKKNQEPS